MIVEDGRNSDRLERQCGVCAEIDYLWQLIDMQTLLFLKREYLGLRVPLCVYSREESGGFCLVENESQKHCARALS